MARKSIVGAALAVTVLLAPTTMATARAGTPAIAGASAGAAAPAVPLLLPASSAFAILGASCGGIREQVAATGFDAPTGDPMGDAFLQTRCNGSGRGGHTTTYSAWAAVTWDLAGAVVSAAALASAPTDLSPTFSSTDAQGDRIYNSLSAINVLPADCTMANTTYCTYTAALAVPAPPAPTGVAVSQGGDDLLVSWTASTRATTASVVTATPTGGGPILTTTAAGAATSVSLAPVAPSTDYSIVVTSGDVGGASPPSVAVAFRSSPATTRPSAPTGVRVFWSTNGTLLQARWNPSVPGNSPVNEYQVDVARSDPNGAPVRIRVGKRTSIRRTGFNNVLDWSVTVRARNTFGWSRWSRPRILGGL